MAGPAANTCVARPGAPSREPPRAPVCRVGPCRTAVDTGAARSRPLAAKAPGREWGRGGRSAQARSPPGGLCARASARTARAEHVAPGPPRVSLTLETQSPRGRRGPGVRARCARVFPWLPTPTQPPHPGLDTRACVSAFGGQSPAGGRPYVRRAFSAPQPRSSRTRSTRLFSATSGKSPRRKVHADVRAGEGRSSNAN